MVFNWVYIYIISTLRKLYAVSLFTGMELYIAKLDSLFHEVRAKKGVSSQVSSTQDCA